MHPKSEVARHLMVISLSSDPFHTNKNQYDVSWHYKTTVIKAYKEYVFH